MRGLASASRPFTRRPSILGSQVRIAEDAAQMAKGTSRHYS